MAFSKRTQHVIGKNLLFHIVAISSTITLILTLLSFLLDYKNERDQLNQTYSYIEKTQLKSIIAAVYAFDELQIKTQANGVLGNPDILSVEIKDEKGNTLYSKEKQEEDFNKNGVDHFRLLTYLPIRGNVEKKTFDLLIASSHKPIGKLTVLLSKDNMFKRITEKFVLIFITQFLKTMIVSCAILILVSHLVTRHIEKMADFLSIEENLEGSETPKKLILDRKKPARIDELDILTTAINEMHSKSQMIKKLMLQKTDQGIVIIGNNGEIGTDFSPRADQLLEIEHLEEKNIVTILSKTDLPASMVGEVYKIITSSIGQHLSYLEKFQHLLPNKLNYYRINYDKPINLDISWDKILDYEENIIQIILYLKDITKKS